MRKKLVLFLALVLACSIVFTACGNKLAGDNKYRQHRRHGKLRRTDGTGTTDKKKTELLVVHVGSDLTPSTRR